MIRRAGITTVLDLPIAGGRRVGGDINALRADWLQP